jgi:hypothetical protein
MIQVWNTENKYLNFDFLLTAGFLSALIMGWHPGTKEAVFQQIIDLNTKIRKY